MKINIGQKCEKIQYRNLKILQSYFYLQDIYELLNRPCREILQKPCLYTPRVYALSDLFITDAKAFNLIERLPMKKGQMESLWPI